MDNETIDQTENKIREFLRKKDISTTNLISTLSGGFSIILKKFPGDIFENADPENIPYFDEIILSACIEFVNFLDEQQ